MYFTVSRINVTWRRPLIVNSGIDGKEWSPQCCWLFRPNRTLFAQWREIGTKIIGESNEETNLLSVWNAELWNGLSHSGDINCLWQHWIDTEMTVSGELTTSCTDREQLGVVVGVDTHCTQYAALAIHVYHFVTLECWLTCHFSL